MPHKWWIWFSLFHSIPNVEDSSMAKRSFSRRTLAEGYGGKSIRLKQVCALCEEKIVKTAGHNWNILCIDIHINCSPNNKWWKYAGMGLNIFCFKWMVSIQKNWKKSKSWEQFVIYLLNLAHFVGFWAGLAALFRSQTTNYTAPCNFDFFNFPWLRPFIFVEKPLEPKSSHLCCLFFGL